MLKAIFLVTILAWGTSHAYREAVIITEEIEESHVGGREESHRDRDADCPIACPFGWNRLGPFTKHCYLLPAQPMRLDTFWKQYEYCQNQEPTSYPAVINNLVEQALFTAVAIQYAGSYALALTNAHLWLGGFVNRNNRWVLADGSEPDGALMLPTKLLGARNGTCLSTDPKTLGVWIPRPCKDDTGVVACEMAPRPVCDGRTGGMLPISGFNPANLGDALLQKMPSIPVIGQPLGGGSLLGGTAKLLGGFFGGGRGSKK